MKTSGLSVFALASCANVVLKGVQAEKSELAGFKWEMQQHSRKLQTECPNTFTPDDMGFPTFLCNPDCECTMEPYTVKEDVAEAISPDTDCFRCAKPSGAACADDFECFGLAQASCE